MGLFLLGSTQAKWLENDCVLRLNFHVSRYKKQQIFVIFSYGLTLEADIKLSNYNTG